MTSYEDIQAFQDAWAQTYKRLAKLIFTKLPLNDGELVELGCGKGQLTIPLAKTASRYKIQCIDNYSGAYSRDLRSLKAALGSGGLMKRVQVIVSDAVRWLERQRGSTYNIIVSSEFLCELDSKGMQHVFGECHRVLKPGGVTIHSFLSPIPRNDSQRLLIEADSDPKWTRHPPLDWFSPPPDLVLEQMKAAGFRGLKVCTSRNRVQAKAHAAKALLESYDVKPVFWKHYRERLMTSGLEMPDWIVIWGTKMRTSPSSTIKKMANEGSSLKPSKFR